MHATSLIFGRRHDVRPPRLFSPARKLVSVGEAVGTGTMRFQSGQPVMGFTGRGGFAEEAAVTRDDPIRVPDGLPFKIAKALGALVNAVTSSDDKLARVLRAGRRCTGRPDAAR